MRLQQHVQRYAISYACKGVDCRATSRARRFFYPQITRHSVVIVRNLFILKGHLSIAFACILLFKTYKLYPIRSN